MEIDEPIQQLLKSTGWSCEDLLSKLQQYKSLKDTNKKDVHSTPEKRCENNAEECVVDSTEEIKDGDNARVQNLAPKSNLSENISEEVDNVVTNSLSISEDFSDTDEEEVEVNATNCSIINEIIDDISSTENVEETAAAKNDANHQSEVNKDETSEVTEVRVIEVNTDEDEDDDSFEEEVSHKVSRTQKLEYLETFPRKIPPAASQPHGKIVDDTMRIADDDNCEIKPGNVAVSGENLKNCNGHSESDEAVGDEDGQQSVSNNKIGNDSILDKKSSENVEDIRNNLKLQLSCLRTRKKGHILEDLRAKVVSDQNKNLNASRDTDTTISPNNTVDNCEKIDDEYTSKINTDDNVLCIDNETSNDLYTQTNEFGLVILNVQGGIDFDDNIENSESCSKASIQEDSLNEHSSTAMDSVLENTTDFNDSNSFPSENNTLSDKEDDDPKGVFDEIRKIIWKQRNPSNKKKYEFLSGTNRPIENIDQPISNSQKFKGKINYESATFSTENSLSSFTTEDTNQTDKNSPFVSNSLDEFLTENSKLNISYKVPKSGAEEGLTDSIYREESPLVLKKVVPVDEQPKPKKVQTVKAKTVAQRRKILEKERLKELKKLRLETEKNNQNKIKADTKSNNKENAVNNKEKKEIKDSFILVNNRKIWVKSTVSDKCIAKVVSKMVSPVKLCTSTNKKKEVVKNNLRQRKLSLLCDLEKKYKQKIKYRPGPLSKKVDLQVSGQDNWRTQMKILPKIFLEITPKIGEPLSLNILNRLPQSDGRLTESQIEFALSVLKTKDTKVQHKRFKFPLSYSNNQEHIIVRKQKISPKISPPCRKLHGDLKSVENIVANVIDDLIKYVEIKEIAPSLIKDDEVVDYQKTDDKIPSNDFKGKMPAISENVSSIFKKPQKKRSRIQLELSRLSCKVVNVEVEESLTEELCNKPYCRLGCLCKSLKCERNTYHCQKVECMLECTCPKERSVVYDNITLPAGTDILSTDTVNRIEDEAKKDLAKVEREFTQTVIHTNDKTIVVGLGGRNKTRRATKAPKKYSDYVESAFESVKPDQKPKTVEKDDFHRKCFVSLEKLNLPGIIPFCWTHNSYDCYCEGKSLFSSHYPTRKPKPEDTPSNPKQIIEEKVEVAEKKKSPVAKKVRNKRVRANDEEEKVDNKSDLSSPADTTGTLDPIPVRGRPVRTIKKPKLSDDFSYSDEISLNSNTDCARVRGAPAFISRRNTARSNKNKMNLLKDDFINNITEADVFKANISDSRQLLEVDLLKNELVAEAKRKMLACSMIIEGSYSDKSKHKRKQTLEVRSDDSSSKSSIQCDLAMQRRKKTGLLTRTNPWIEPVFDGEIIIDRRNLDLLKKMGPKTVSEGYARLLPWRALTRTFKNGSIKIWCMVDQPSRLLINKGDKQPPKNYINIRQTNQTSEVILWILKNQLPAEYHEDHVSFILKQTKDNFEICGLCTKNFTEETLSRPIIESDDAIEQIDENLIPFKHRDFNGESQMLYITKSRFKLQELVEENLAGIGETSVGKNKLYMWAALPEIYRVCKWRMLFLNSDFTYLYFTSMKYSIKYTDLVAVDNMAKAAKCTLVLRNPLIQQAYDHSAFGIYFDPHYQDRLFIGPYFKQFNGDDIETLRYINKSLVCTESFNKMQGKMDYKCGHWLIERPYGSTRRRPDLEQMPSTSTSTSTSEPTIDLTNDEHENENNEVATDRKRKSDGDSSQDSKRLKSDKDHIVIVHNNVKIKVIDGVPRKPHDFNRFIITNIPHFGYLGAYQHHTSSEIDVSWPFENKLLRFPTVNTATEFLQERFGSLLQPIPETFKINVIVLTSIDLENSHPINASILTGHYICGDFGCYNVKTITNDFCLENLGMTREELLKVFARRAQAFVKTKIEELASLLCITKTELGRYDMANILDMAKHEILVQNDLERHHMTKKNDLLLRKRELALKVFAMISRLPDDQKRSENLKFRKILRKHSFALRNTITEPIEIPDSDEEETTPNVDTSNSAGSNQSVLLLETSQYNSAGSNQSVLLPETSQSNSAGSNQSVLLPETSQVPSEGPPTISLFMDKNIPSKVVEIPSAFPQQRKLKLKSVLKPITPTPSLLSKMEPRSIAPKEPIPSSSKTDASQTPKTPSPPQFLKGVKIIKTSSGKLVLVSDKTNSQGKLNSKIGTKVVIKDNKILSIKSMEANKEKCVQPVSILGTSSSNINVSNNNCIPTIDNCRDAANITTSDENKNANTTTTSEATDNSAIDNTTNEDKPSCSTDNSKSCHSFEFCDTLKKCDPEDNVPSTTDDETVDDCIDPLMTDDKIADCIDDVIEDNAKTDCEDTPKKDDTSDISDTTSCESKEDTPKTGSDNEVSKPSGGTADETVNHESNTLVMDETSSSNNKVSDNSVTIMEMSQNSVPSVEDSVPEDTNEEINSDNSSNGVILEDSSCNKSNIPEKTKEETINEDNIIKDDFGCADNETDMKKSSETNDSISTNEDTIDETVSDITETNNCDDRNICVETPLNDERVCKSDNESGDV